MNIKVFNSMFPDASYSFAMLRFYYGHVTDLLHTSAAGFQKFTDELEIENNKSQKKFDKQAWLKHYDVYAGVYPGLFSNSFLISACALFEYQIKKICELAKKEHRIPREWDAMEGSVPVRAKRFLWIGGIILKDAPLEANEY